MATILYTSLAEIKSFNPCPEGWKDILKGQGKKEKMMFFFLWLIVSKVIQSVMYAGCSEKER
jgi:hypothetical protein